MNTLDWIARLRAAARQEQFLDVVTREEAQRRFHAHLRLAPLSAEDVPLAQARERVLARDVVATVDVPGFDRASVDGFAVRAEDTAGATAQQPRVLTLTPDMLTPGVQPRHVVQPGTATLIATGGMLPRGADAVVMVEHTEIREAADGAPDVEVHTPVAPGRFVAAAGSDIALGETVLRRGHVLTSREIGMLAAVGMAEAPVWRRPVVAIFSTGDEIVAPSTPIRPGQVYDSNAAVLAAAVQELGCAPLPLGIVADDAERLEATLRDALARADAVLLSGGTSKGAGDLAAGVVGKLADPGIVVHGVALKPGKPLCLAVSAGKPVAILPGFPTSAIFTFQEFVAPVLRAMSGRPAARQSTVGATLPLRISSERGRTEYVLASLLRTPDAGLAAYPTAKGSGAVTAFAQADGFFAVPANTETVAAGTPVTVQLIGAGLEPADLVVIGSHCVGLDRLIGLLEAEGLRVRSLAVGSSGGLAAAKRGECDLAGIHLMDPETGIYNMPYLTPALTLVPGYGRMQGAVFRTDNPKFRLSRSVADVVAVASADPDCLMVNRNAGSGTRILIDRLLGTTRPAGYMHQAKSHNAVAAAVAQHRADWGLAIDTVAREYGLGFLPLQAEQYDFVVPRARWERAPVQRFVALLQSDAGQQLLRALGFAPTHAAATKS
jgi:putative molybdopterin biosynthesis protein